MSLRKWIYYTVAVLVIYNNTAYGAILPMWNDERAYHPIPATFVHGMNSSPEAWGFAIDPDTGNVVFYFGTSAELRQYFDTYYTFGESREKFPYLEPFNYQFNTFDSIKWNAWEGYDNTERQYPDGRISLARRFNSPTLRRYIHKPPEVPTDLLGGILSKYRTDKIQLVAHSLGGVVSRYYLHNTKSGGANVLQLTTLGSPHRGTTVAKISEMMVGTPVTDIQNMGVVRRRWVIKFFSRFFSQLTVDRYPMMISELNRNSNFMGELNEPFSIPRHLRYYCIADALIPIPCSTIISPIITMTDGFIDLDSALAVLQEEKLPCPPLNLEEYKPKGYLPKYKGKLISGFENWHIKLTNNAGEILKAIDDIKPVIELTEVKDTQNKVIWRVGQWPDYFVVPTDGRVKVYGLCRKEYLPADTSINIGFRKAGQTDVNWITESGGTTPDQTQARQWLLQPSNLWIASNTDSPVAEFEVEIDFPLQEVTHSIVVQATNPAGIKSDPVEVSEKTNYIYAVGKDEDEGAKFLCLDGPTSFADGMSAVVSEFNLIDEAGNKISARPLDVTTDGGSTIWVSFDNNRIYCYDIATMEPKQLPGSRYYYTTTGTPDGLSYDGNLQYCSSSNNKIYRINITDGTETDLGEVKRRLSIDGVVTDSPSVNYTTQEYTSYNPTCISTNYLCSLGKISKRGGNNSLIQTLPTNTPIWTDEQSTPAPVVGIVEVTDLSVPGGRATYYSSTDGNVYKVRFKDKVVYVNVSAMWQAASAEASPSHALYPYYAAWRGFSPNSGKYQLAWSNWLFTHISRMYAQTPTLPSFIEAFVIHKPDYMIYQHRWDGTRWISEDPNVPIASTIFSICSYDETGTAEQQFHAPITGPILWIDDYNTDASPDSYYRYFEYKLSPIVKVTNVSDLAFPFYYTGRYGNEGQSFPVGPTPIPSPLPVGYISMVQIQNIAGARYSWGGGIQDTWVAITDNGTLDTQDQFSMPTTIAEGIASGPRVNIKAEPQDLSLMVGQTGQLRVNGKGPYIWTSSDDAVVVIEGISGVTVTIKAVGVGTAAITVRDSLGNIAKTTVNVSAS